MIKKTNLIFFGIAPSHPPSAIVVVGFASSSLVVSWSRPSGLVSQRELPLNYTICFKDYILREKVCTNNGAKLVFTKTGLISEIKYEVSISAKSHDGIGPTGTIYTKTLPRGNSRNKNDMYVVSYRCVY